MGTAKPADRGPLDDPLGPVARGVARRAFSQRFSGARRRPLAAPPRLPAARLARRGGLDVEHRIGLARLEVFAGHAEGLAGGVVEAGLKVAAAAVVFDLAVALHLV